MSTINYKVKKVAPAAQASTAAYVVVAGSGMDVVDYASLAYTLKAVTNDVKWKVFGANISDYSDEVEVQGEATVSAGAVGSYAVSIAPYAYYRVKIIDAVAGHSTVTVSGIAKR